MTEFVCRRTGQAYEVGEQLDQNGDARVHAVVSAGPDLVLKHYLPATLARRPDLEARIKAMIAHPPRVPPRPDRPGALRMARGRRLRFRAVRRIRHATRRHFPGGHDPPRHDPARHHLARPGRRRREPGPGRRGAPRGRRRHRRLPRVEPADLERLSRHPARLRPDAGRGPRVGKTVPVRRRTGRLHSARTAATCLVVEHIPGEQQRHLHPGPASALAVAARRAPLPRAVDETRDQPPRTRARSASTVVLRGRSRAGPLPGHAPVDRAARHAPAVLPGRLRRRRPQPRSQTTRTGLAHRTGAPARVACRLRA